MNTESATENLVRRSKFPRFLRISAVVFVAIFTFAMYSLQANSAVAPSTISYQGKLLVGGYSASTTQQMYFILYDSLSGGSILYTASGTVGTPTFVNVTPVLGLFTVDLGDTGTNALDPNIFKNNSDIYLEVRIGAETLTPRKKITATPYAFNSRYLDGVAPSTNTNTTYIPISDSSGNFNFNNVTSTGAHVSGLLNVIGNSYFGTIASGTWQGQAISTGFGGTGQDSLGWTGFAYVDSGAWTATTTIPSGSLPDNVMIEGENISLLTNNAGYLTSFAETDPIFMAASSSFALTVHTHSTSSITSGVFSTAYGGTGTSTAPTLGQLLMGNASGGYSLVATNSLGFASSTGSDSYIWNQNLSDQTADFRISGTGTLAAVGIGTTSPITKLTIDSAVSTSSYDGISLAGGGNATAFLGHYNLGGSGGLYHSGYLALYNNISNQNSPPVFFSTWSKSAIEGGLNVGTTTYTGAGLFNVGASQQFQVDSSGDLIKINNLSYSWPSAHGASGTLMTQDGSGNLSWVSTSSLGFIGTGTDTTSSPAGSTGQIQFNNAGFFGATTTFVWDDANGRLGINTTTPSYALSVAGDINTIGTYRIAGIDYGQYFINSAGIAGQLWSSNGSGRGAWVATSSLGLLGSDIGGFTAGSVIFASSTGVLTQDNSNFFWDDTNDRLGIGTTTPLSKLHVDDGGFLITGTTGATPVSGVGSRLMWIPEKSAFRAGAINDYSPYPFPYDQWDDANIGLASAAFGINTLASGDASAAFGALTSATGLYSVAFGLFTQANSTGSVAFGFQSISSADYSFAAGYQTLASGERSVAFGDNTEASGAASTAFGSASVASGQNSIAFGSGSIASALDSTAFGFYTEANANYSTSFGYDTTASGEYSTSFGSGSIAGGYSATAFGQSTVANGYNATAFGLSTSALGDYSTAFGRSITVNGDSSLGINVSSDSYTLSQNNTIALMGGNVGIGTTSPSSLLTVGNGGEFQVNSSGDLIKINNLSYSWPSAHGASGTLMTQDGSGNLSWVSTSSLGLSGGGGLTGSGTSTEIAFWSGTNSLTSTNTFYWDNTNGRLGIGTSSPSTKLHIVSPASASEEGLYISGNYGTDKTAAKLVSYLTSGDSVAGKLSLLDDEDEKILINANGASYFNAGNVGIGTTTPSYKLTVVGDISVTGTLRVGNSADAGTGGFILMSNGASLAPTWVATSTLGLLGSSIGGFTAGSVIFASSTGVLTQDNLNIFWDDTNNRLGIGTTTPREKLDVAGKIAINGNSFIYVPDQDAYSGTMYVGVGDGGAYLEVGGMYNTFFGKNAGHDNTSGDSNTGIGHSALYRNQTGQFNTAVGLDSLQNNTTGSGNTALGEDALNSNIGGDNNVAVGFLALRLATSTSEMVAVGYAAGNGAGSGYASITDTKMVYLGALTSRTSSIPITDFLTNGIAIGYDAKVLGSNMAVIGNNDVTSVYMSNDGGAAIYFTPSTTAAATTKALCHDGSGGASWLFDCNGAPAADYMEYYAVDNDVSVGDVVVMSDTYVSTTDGNTIPKLSKASGSYNNQVIGILSDESQANDFNSTAATSIKEEDNPDVLALSGRVIVKVTTDNGPISKGDKLTSSDRPGYAMKATAEGPTVGIAMGDFSGSATGTMMVFVNLSWNNTIYRGLTLDTASNELKIKTPTLSFATTTFFNSYVSSSLAATNAFIMNAVNFNTSTQNNYILSLRSNNSPVFSVSSNGDVISTGNIYASSMVLGTSTNPGDLAERVDINPNETVEAGDVMMVDPNYPDQYQKTNLAYEPTVAGVISTNPTIVVGNGKTNQTAPLAMVGRVPVKITTINGLIKRGDLLVASNIPGTAMKYDPANDDSQKIVGIIGIALDNAGDSHDGKIMALIRTGWVYNKTEALVELQNQIGSMSQEGGELLIPEGGEDLTVIDDNGTISYSGVGHLNLSGNALINVSYIASSNNAWAINEYGLLIARVTTSEGDKNIYGMSSEVAEITISGTGTLQMGEIIITFATSTQEIIDESQPIKVNVTLTSLEALSGIAVIEKSAQGFKVKELNNGTSSSTFDWIVIAKRKMLNLEVEIPPTESAPVETVPTETTFVETTPVDTTPIETTPVETPPTETIPDETTPVEIPPTEITPTETIPTETTPAETTPTEAVPDETTPVETTPIETASIETAPTP